MVITLVLLAFIAGGAAGFVLGDLRGEKRMRLHLTDAERRAHVAEQHLDSARKDMALQVGHGFQQAAKVVDAAHGTMQTARDVMIEAQSMIRESVDMAKQASRFMFGMPDVDGTLPPPSTVGEADRAVTRRRKEEAGATKP